MNGDVRVEFDRLDQRIESLDEQVGLLTRLACNFGEVTEADLKRAVDMKDEIAELKRECEAKR